MTFSVKWEMVRPEAVEGGLTVELADALVHHLTDKSEPPPGSPAFGGSVTDLLNESEFDGPEWAAFFEGLSWGFGDDRGRSATNAREIAELLRAGHTVKLTVVW